MKKKVNMAANEESNICDNWEEFDETGLDQQLSTIMANQELEPPEKPSRFNGCNVVLDENTVESQFMNQETSITILKRPPSCANGLGNNESRARTVKTFEQRKKEYEEARLRILGEAKSPEDCLDDKLTLIEDRLKSPDKIIVQERPPFSGITSESRKSPPGVLILRTPKAPDGTNGFTERR